MSLKSKHYSKKKLKTLKQKFPRYFLVDDTLIKIDFDPLTNEVFALNKVGIAYPPLKALSIGEEISLEEFSKLLK